MRNLILIFLAIGTIACGQQEKGADRDEIQPILVAESNGSVSSDVNAVEHFGVSGDLTGVTGDITDVAGDVTGFAGDAAGAPADAPADAPPLAPAPTTV